MADRRAAAARILRSRPQRTDRRIATVVGLSVKTVASARKWAGGDGFGTAGMGGGGVARDGGVARGGGAGCDGGVVHGGGVRHGDGGGAGLADLGARRAESVEPVAESGRDTGSRLPVVARVVPASAAASVGGGDVPALVPVRGGDFLASGSDRGGDPQECLSALARDPALRSTDAGRALLRALATLQLIGRDGSADLLACVPDHGLPLFQLVARANAEHWRSLAALATQRERGGQSGRARRQVTA